MPVRCVGLVGTSFCDGFDTKAVSSFKRRAIYRGIESCVMSERNSWKEILHILYCESSHLVRHPLKCCMKRSTTALDLGLCDPVVICSIPRYLFIAATTPLTNSGASSLRNESGIPFWRIIPERSALATLSCFLLLETITWLPVWRSTATRISPCSWP